MFDSFEDRTADASLTQLPIFRPVEAIGPSPCSDIFHVAPELWTSREPVGLVLHLGPDCWTCIVVGFDPRSVVGYWVRILVVGPEVLGFRPYR